MNLKFYSKLNLNYFTRWISNNSLEKQKSKFNRFISQIALILIAGSLSIATNAIANDEVTGAGASFPAPLYAKWASEYNKATKIKINYQSIGSSAGLKQIEAKTVDFGASDAPLKEADLQSKGLIQFPTVIGGVVPVVNIKGILAGQLKLTGALLADIYLGKITKWNDSAIVALNPTLSLPDEKITPIRRADGSGTSFIFTNYLSKISPEWKEKIGEGTIVNWPIGVGGKGNEGVAAFISRLPYSIGYVEYAYVKQNKMNYAQLQNADGQFVSPDDLSFKAAAENANWSQSFYQILTNQKGKNAWPITGATFILMHLKQDKPEQAENALRFFNWAYQKGDSFASDLDYVPMPDNVKSIIIQSWNKLTDSSTQKILNIKY